MKTEAYVVYGSGADCCSHAAAKKHGHVVCKVDGKEVVRSPVLPDKAIATVYVHHHLRPALATLPETIVDSLLGQARREVDRSVLA